MLQRVPRAPVGFVVETRRSRRDRQLDDALATWLGLSARARAVLEAVVAGKRYHPRTAANLRALEELALFVYECFHHRDERLWLWHTRQGLFLVRWAAAARRRRD